MEELDLQSMRQRESYSVVILSEAFPVSHHSFVTLSEAQRSRTGKRSRRTSTPRKGASAPEVSLTLAKVRGPSTALGMTTVKIDAHHFSLGPGGSSFG